MSTKKELINSQEFEDALTEGAECKKDIMTSYKHQNKSNFSSFSEIMFEADEDIKKILDTKKSKRTDADKEQLEEFKKNIRQMYNQAQALTVDEHLEDGKKTKIEKIVEKIVPVIHILRYIGNTELDKEFARHGITLTCKSLEDKYASLASDDKKKSITELFTSATNIKQKTLDDTEYISSDLFTKKVPVELQYDKGTNNAGLKPSDFKKLVDMKTKLVMAQTKEAKEKAEEKIEKAAGDKQFEVARAELVRDKLANMQ